VERSTVGALHLANERPDLATSQVRLSGRSRSVFSQVRFDCGIVASDASSAEIESAVVPPQYARLSGEATVKGLVLSTKP
jgi:hypothetical protein